MADLYTSLTRLKMAMNGGQLPPMTPLTEDAKRYIDPAFTIGMGALVEDEKRGLLCPVRGCGKHYHMLKRHANTAHRAIGGDAAIRSALSISETTPLISQRAKKRCSVAMKARQALAPVGFSGSVLNAAANRTAEMRRRRGARMSSSCRTTGYLNLRDRCDAQINTKLIALAEKLGHSPSEAEAKAEYGGGFVRHLSALYGSWNLAKSAMGLRAMLPSENNVQLSEDQVLDHLNHFYAVHHRFPTTVEANVGGRVTPAIPAYNTIRRAMDASSWAEVVSKAAFILGHEPTMVSAGDSGPFEPNPALTATR